MDNSDCRITVISTEKRQAQSGTKYFLTQPKNSIQPFKTSRDLPSPPSIIPLWSQLLNQRGSLLLFLGVFFQGYCSCHCRLLAQLCPTLCDPMNCNPPGSSVLEIFQARILESGAISSFRGSSQPRNWTHISCISRQTLYHWVTREA